MIQELIYTSVPRGLAPGAKGFCVVASTRNIPPHLARLLESLSGFRPVSGVSKQPVAWSHLEAELGGQRYRILSRVSDYGMDYSQRTNKLAHHAAVTDESLPQAGPAWVLSRNGYLSSEWSGEPRILTQRSLPSGASEASVCSTWVQVTGDAGWGGVLAQTVIDGVDAWIVVSSQTDALALVQESIALLPHDRRWEATFCTYYLSHPPNVRCRWKFVIAGCPEAGRVRTGPGQIVIDTTKPYAAPDSPAAQAARAGKAIGEARKPIRATPTQRKTESDSRFRGEPTSVFAPMDLAPDVELDRAESEAVFEELHLLPPELKSRTGATRRETQGVAPPVPLPPPPTSSSSSRPLILMVAALVLITLICVSVLLIKLMGNPPTQARNSPKPETPTTTPDTNSGGENRGSQNQGDWNPNNQDQGSENQTSVGDRYGNEKETEGERGPNGTASVSADAPHNSGANSDPSMPPETDVEKFDPDKLRPLIEELRSIDLNDECLEKIAQIWRATRDVSDTEFDKEIEEILGGKLFLFALHRSGESIPVSELSRLSHWVSDRMHWLDLLKGKLRESKLESTRHEKLSQLIEQWEGRLSSDRSWSIKFEPSGEVNVTATLDGIRNVLLERLVVVHGVPRTIDELQCQLDVKENTLMVDLGTAPACYFGWIENPGSEESRKTVLPLFTLRAGQRLTYDQEQGKVNEVQIDSEIEFVGASIFIRQEGTSDWMTVEFEQEETSPRIDFNLPLSARGDAKKLFDVLFARDLSAPDVKPVLAGQIENSAAVMELLFSERCVVTVDGPRRLEIRRLSNGGTDRFTSKPVLPRSLAEYWCRATETEGQFKLQLLMESNETERQAREGIVLALVRDWLEGLKGLGTFHKEKWERQVALNVACMNDTGWPLIPRPDPIPGSDAGDRALTEKERKWKAKELEFQELLSEYRTVVGSWAEQSRQLAELLRPFTGAAAEEFSKIEFDAATVTQVPEDPPAFADPFYAFLKDDVDHGPGMRRWDIAIQFAGSEYKVLVQVEDVPESDEQ